MALATVASLDYMRYAEQLIKTYRQHFSGKVFLYYFNGEKPTIDADEYILVPDLCAHAYNPRFYFYKAFVIQDMMQKNDSFLYLDSCHRILGYPKEVLNTLDTKSRFFVCYPKSVATLPSTTINVGTLTTKRCLEEMGCDADQYREAPMYWAAIQAWTPTEENRRFANEFLESMKILAVAGPSNLVNNPEPGNPLCRAHRNDQSVLSVLIEKYGFQQPYDDEVWAKYGDHDTIRTVTPRSVIKGRIKLEQVVADVIVPTPVVIKREARKLYRCVVCSTTARTIGHGRPTTRVTLQAHTPVTLELSVDDMGKLRRNGCDVAERN